MAAPAEGVAAAEGAAAAEGVAAVAAVADWMVTVEVAGLG